MILSKRGATTPLVLAWLTCLVGGSEVAAEFLPVEDQQNVLASGDSSARVGVSNTQRVAQTFVVGITGQLTTIDVQVARGANAFDPVTAELVRTRPDGSPDESSAATLASLSLASTRFPVSTGFTGVLTSIDFEPANIAVTEGDRLAIVLSSNASSSPALQRSYRWMASSDGYDQGMMYFNGFASGNEWWPGVLSVAQVGFRTYVRPIPEPSGLLLAGLAGASLASASPAFGRQRAPRGVGRSR